MMIRFALAVTGAALLSLSCQTRTSNDAEAKYFDSIDAQYFDIEPSEKDASELMCVYKRKKEKSTFTLTAQAKQNLPIREADFLNHFLNEAYLKNERGRLSLSEITIEEFQDFNEEKQKELAKIIIVKQVIAALGTATTYTGGATVGILAYPWVQVTAIPAIGTLLTNEMFIAAAGALFGAGALTAAGEVESIKDIPPKTASKIALAAGYAAFMAFALAALPAVLFESVVDDAKRNKTRAEDAYLAALAAKKYFLTLKVPRSVESSQKPSRKRSQNRHPSRMVQAAQIQKRPGHFYKNLANTVKFM